MAKFIFVTGGVVSGLGKGITAASLGRLLKARGLKVAAQKLDPYINVDPGTMSPYQHGEVYVTEDGLETDLDLGHYERFIDEDLNKFSNLTTGKVYWNVLNKERRGRVPGRDHPGSSPTSPRRSRALSTAWGRSPTPTWSSRKSAAPPATLRASPSWRPSARCPRGGGGKFPVYPRHAGALFEKLRGAQVQATQHSVKELQSMGIKPDIIVLRTDEPITDPSIFHKIALFCNVRPDCVIENLTIPVLYEAPIMLEKSHFSEIVCRELCLETPSRT